MQVTGYFVNLRNILSSAVQIVFYKRIQYVQSQKFICLLLVD